MASTYPTRLCEYCRGGFTTRVTAQRFCSRSCVNRARPPVPTRRKSNPCLHCNAQFYPKLKGARFCSLQCFGVWRARHPEHFHKNNTPRLPNVRGGGKGRYRLVRVGRDHPMADDRGYALEHRMVMSGYPRTIAHAH